jgi:hypothetical protein
VSSVDLRTARAKVDGTFARMLVRTAGRWIAKGGTVSAQTRLVGMRGHEPHCLVGCSSGMERGGDVYCAYIWTSFQASFDYDVRCMSSCRGD